MATLKSKRGKMKGRKKERLANGGAEAALTVPRSKFERERGEVAE